MDGKIMEELVKFILTHPSKQALAKKKLALCKKYKVKKIPTDFDILLNAPAELLPKLAHFVSKPTRTISGVAVIAVMTKPIACPHGKCIYCPGGPGSFFGDVPMSYTGKEPSTMRAIRNMYDPYLIVFNRLEQYVALNQPAEKVEIIIQGGTFPAFPKKYQEEVIISCFKALNDFSRLFFKDGTLDLKKYKEFFELPGDITDEERGKRVRAKTLKVKGDLSATILEREQRKNEKTFARCVGLTIETKPDWGMLKEGNMLLRLGCTRIELGVQTVYEDVIKKLNRGHNVEDSKKSTQELKDLGFKINYHMMPGLPGTTPRKDLEGLLSLFTDEGFMPDMLKIYPCMVMPGTPLYEMWKKGRFVPLRTKQAARLIAQFMGKVPEWVRIMRVQRDIPTTQTSDGVDRTNLRQYIDEEMKKRGLVCCDIRAREVGRYTGKIGKVGFKVSHYRASGGNEFFIQAAFKGYLLGYCRLRFPKENLRKEITPSTGIIRELHVFGQQVGIGKTGEVQHRGIGRKLLAIAEDLCRTYYKDKIVVISGVGVREYYKKLGYRKEGVYMVRKIA
ncbi:tRNA uridine(34) 5-carboxymethylaminomethyl modification radical SAM/GNAT enzyme Elp3 [Candidatus Woesearchaeota archaeon]|nr:MAG: elongator complex protein 3 [archaeon GW2011_AR4]MBS3130519.1 tRNA uridine(34) 5-carboxymethylaminomethyl modification radical SAM/GNAT enzyme Elp3 [Candidatus Woesearchaeota archaeon]HIH37999.1 tRNA uridine(34) 5-carboxymethylaminomethyl modification radical SAM/GNAT enzyme Elp3 [Candidatus Woesearchaeota archaeon]HIH48668.1 tRNA uridine(34) 5-carboxymethylaminomethyl modification radical SAM/GNAT enzyme Elp3 [Candidatus Woesearchaeota archaeon]HIJ02968.1 tRNA uridine(34) 5-carboxymeth